jgi:hypothetical protein
MLKFTIAFIFFSFSNVYSQSVTWFDIETKELITLDRNLKFEVEYDEFYELQASTKLVVWAIDPLPMINVTIFTMIPEKGCSIPHKDSEMSLEEINLPNGKQVIVGIQMLEMCYFQFFIENKDLKYPSFFSL